MVMYTWTNISISNWQFLIPCYHQNSKGNVKHILFQQGRIRVIVFNVPFPYIYHFPNFSKIRGATLLASHHSINQIWACAIYLELSFILFTKFLPFFMQILDAKIFKIQNFFFTSFEKSEQQTHSLWTRK